MITTYAADELAPFPSEAWLLDIFSAVLLYGHAIQRAKNFKAIG
jgi:hypothetical protein